MKKNIQIIIIGFAVLLFFPLESSAHGVGGEFGSSTSEVLEYMEEEVLDSELIHAEMSDLVEKLYLENLNITEADRLIELAKNNTLVFELMSERYGLSHDERVSIVDIKSKIQDRKNIKMLLFVEVFHSILWLVVFVFGIILVVRKRKLNK